MILTNKNYARAFTICRCTCALLVAVLLAGCRTADVRPPPGQYPTTKFMAATGYGNDTQSAINDARAELSRIISVHIRDEFEMTEKSLRITDNNNVRNEYERYVTSKTSAVTDNDLFATTVAGNWYDRERKTRAALVVLERSVAGSRYASQIKSAVEQSTLLSGQAAARLDEGRHAAALQNTIDALRQRQEAIRMQLIAMIVCPGLVTVLTMIDPEFVAAIKAGKDL